MSTRVVYAGRIIAQSLAVVNVWKVKILCSWDCPIKHDKWAPASAFKIALCAVRFFYESTLRQCPPLTNSPEAKTTAHNRYTQRSCSVTASA